MRKPIIAGNWKMNKTPAEAAQLVTELIPLVKDAACDVVVCTPAVCFAAVAPIIEGTNIKLGAQNVHFEAKGAFTGELSADMLKASGCEYVIIGHFVYHRKFCTRYIIIKSIIFCILIKL